MNPTELKDLANTLNGIADGKPWQISGGDWWDASDDHDPVTVMRAGKQIRLKPWELTDTVNGHTLPPGAEWHRQDFPESILPPPYRPLMKGEVPIVGDQYCSSLSSWLPIGDGMRKQPAEFWPELWHRTTRPIPAPEPQWVPLGPEDVPPGTVLRGAGEVDSKGWCMITSCSETGIRIWRDCECYQDERTWGELKDRGSQINRPRHRDADGNPTKWEPCRKQSNS